MIKIGDLLKRITNSISSLSKGLSSKSLTPTAPQTSSYPVSSPVSGFSHPHLGPPPHPLLLPRGAHSSTHGKKKVQKKS